MRRLQVKLANTTYTATFPISKSPVKKTTKGIFLNRSSFPKLNQCEENVRGKKLTKFYKQKGRMKMLSVLAR